MKKVVNFTDAGSSGLRKKAMAGPDSNSDRDANFSYRLYLIVDVAVYEMIVWLKTTLESPSLGDVIRQAVRAYALAFAKDGRVETVDIGRTLEGDQLSDTDGIAKKLNIRIPVQTKDRLDLLTGKTGDNYTKVVTAGLALLYRSAQAQEVLLSGIEKGGGGACVVDDAASAGDDLIADGGTSRWQCEDVGPVPLAMGGSR